MNVNEFTTFRPKPNAADSASTMPASHSHGAAPGVGATIRSNIANDVRDRREMTTGIPCLDGYQRHLVRVHDFFGADASQVLASGGSLGQQQTNTTSIIDHGSTLTVDVHNLQNKKESCNESDNVSYTVYANGGNSRSKNEDNNNTSSNDMNADKRQDFDECNDDEADEEGCASPILFVHGLASNMSIFWECARVASKKGCPVAIMSLRGHAESSYASAPPSSSSPPSPSSSSQPSLGVDGACSLLQSAHDIWQILQFLRQTYPAHWCRKGCRAIVVGHSYGANVLVKLASFSSAAESILGIVGVDGGYINLASRYASIEACCQALAPPNLQYMSHRSFKHMIRSEWARGQPDETIQHLLRNFEFESSSDKVHAKLELLPHMAFLRDLYENPPVFSAVVLPLLLLPAGSGDANHFSSSVKNDLDRVREAVPNNCKVSVKWFPQASHMFLPLEFPDVIMETIITHKWQ